MTYAANEGFLETDLPTQVRTVVEHVAPKTFAANGAAPTLPKLTPVAFDTAAAKWKVWTNGGANGTGTIAGFIYPEPVTLDDTDDVLGNVLLKGTVHYDDIALPTGETAANLKTALRSGPRGLGLTIQGLDQVR